MHVSFFKEDKTTLDLADKVENIILLGQTKHYLKGQLRVEIRYKNSTMHKY